MSASSKTMSGDLPPSSMVTSLSDEAAALAITFLPVATPPVKEILAMSGCWLSAWPTRQSPCTTLKTPAGRPASRKISARWGADSGVTSLGLKIMALPAASAGADFHMAIWMG